MAANIAQRAREVERMGEYVGAFELVVWAHMEGVRVRLVVGGSLIDVLEYYSHGLPALPADAREDIFVACNILVDGLSRKLLAVDTSDEAEVAFGHYVIGTRCRRGVPVSIGPVGSGVALRPVCLALGVAVVETQELGDCGVDAMCFHQGGARTPAGFKRVRLDLAKYMRSVAEDEIWQLCFQACEGQHTPKPPAGPTSKSVLPTVERKGSPESPDRTETAIQGAMESGPSELRMLVEDEDGDPDVGPLQPMMESEDGSPELEDEDPDFDLFGPRVESENGSPELEDENPDFGPLQSNVCMEEGDRSPDFGHCEPRMELDEQGSPELRMELASTVVTSDALTAAPATTFVEWLQGLSAEDRLAITVDYQSFMEAREVWHGLQPPVGDSKRRKLKTQQRSVSKFDHRVSIGLEYFAWALAQGLSDSSKYQISRFCKSRWSYSGPVPKKTKVWVRRCIDQAKGIQDGKSFWKYGKHVRNKMNAKVVRRDLRSRKYSLAGRPPTAPMLRDALWDWFVSVRSAVAARIPAKVVLLKAKQIATEMVKHMRTAGCFIDLPVLDKHWLYRWKRDFRVSLRKPNTKYKCSRAVLRDRLRAMWLTNVRVRALAWFALGIDITIYGWDQKGIFMNEAGSKNMPVLAFEGAPVVPLKENHSSTRQRVSLMTSVVSTKSRLESHGLPLEIMFKGTEKVLRGIETQAGVPVSLQASPKGSYREEHVLAFLSRWLPLWTAERAEAKDYLFVYLDAYSAHLTPVVRELCWERGCAVGYHGGCTTGITQVNDTDLHAAFEREYLALEQVQFFEQNLWDPGNISRTRQQVVDDAVATWLALDHEQGVDGHKRVGLSVDLFQGEDHLVTRDAKIFWDEIGFGQVRDEEVAKIREAVEGGKLTWCFDDIESLREPWPAGDVGSTDEGEEVFCEADLDEPEWHDDDEDSQRSFDDSEDGDATQAGALVPVVSVDAVALPSDTLEDVNDARVYERRMGVLEQMNAAALSSKIPAVHFHVQREMDRLRKQKLVGDRNTGPNKLLRRFVRRRREEEEKELSKVRAANREKARLRQAEKLALRTARRKNEERRLAEAAAREELAKLPREFSTAAFGQGHAAGGTRAHREMREICLERLRLRSPPLKLELRARWDEFKKKYARWMGDSYKAAVGVRFLEKIRGVLEDLEEHSLTQEGFARVPDDPENVRGDEKAFDKFVKSGLKKIPMPATSLVV